ncbi:nuclear transport factor 2 family protein [Nocardia arthritidis]|uniref:DUF4440 domain-containing protein n=1 Tax=Nocardia arthritidis TaxID=228602 RepID=A0A6G9Y641_9NOCA|nr:nuclear transport factor 2 family protein [Nocardia arthritidis]QIS08659.1 DUF4440 domain-containing protein [Nocardia arthritidis]
MMTEQGNAAAVRAAYDLLDSGDLEGFLELLDPEFVATQSDAVPWRGSYRGPEEAREMFGRVGKFAEATYRADEFIDGGERIVVIGAATITPHLTGRPATVRELHVWRVRDGRLLGLDIFLNAPQNLLTELAQSRCRTARVAS